MDSLQVEELLKKCGAIQEGHFLLTSGLHSARYVEKFRVLERPEYTEPLCKEIADRFRADRVSTVVGPVTGGIILSYEVARQLGVRGIFTERENEGMALRRGFTVIPGERVLVVEDIVTTGKSVFEVLKALRAAQAEVVGVGLLVDRSVGTVDFGARKESLIRLEIPAYTKEQCPLCAQGSTPVKPGSRKVS